MSAASAARPDRVELAPGLEVPRLLVGLWQVADQERSGTLDRERAAAALVDYVDAGFDAFDMADHYGSAELIAGRARAMVAARGRAAPPRLLTKWCPEPGPMSRGAVRDGLRERLERLGVERIDLLQLHWWTFDHPAWLDAFDELERAREEGLVANLGVTNFDTDHLHLLLREGYAIATNQVCVSLLDRRALEEMSALCLECGVRLLAYGTLAGGLLTERWLGEAEPAPESIADWSKMKYRRFVEAAGGWEMLQGVLGAVGRVARRRGASIANVATRWVLDQSAVAAAIVGARLGEREHRADNLAVFDCALDEDDRAEIDEALAASRRLPGDCGTEYRRPPFLTASGDLSHHLEGLPRVYAATAVDGRPDRRRVDSGSEFEPVAGYCRALRVGDRVLVSGTTATHGESRVVCAGDARGQAVYILDKIAASLAALGASLEDVVRTRIYLADVDDWEAVSRVHGRYLGAVRPANTLLEVGRLVGDYRVEIEAEAVVGGAG